MEAAEGEGAGEASGEDAEEFAREGAEAGVGEDVVKFAAEGAEPCGDGGGFDF